VPSRHPVILQTDQKHGGIGFTNAHAPDPFEHRPKMECGGCSGVVSHQLGRFLARFRSLIFPVSRPFFSFARALSKQFLMTVCCASFLFPRIPQKVASPER
jgi:hypothetical protein